MKKKSRFPTIFSRLQKYSDFLLISDLILCSEKKFVLLLLFSSRDSVSHITFGLSVEFLNRGTKLSSKSGIVTSKFQNEKCGICEWVDWWG